MSICLEWARASETAKVGRLTIQRARETLNDIMRRSGAEPMPCASVRAYLRDWLTTKTDELAERSLTAYEQAVTQLLDFLGAKADGPIEAVSSADVVAFRAFLVRRVSPATANKTLAALRGAWTSAVKDKLLEANPFADVGGAKVATGAAKRRAFTIPEVQLILGKCDPEWRGMVFLGLYTGQRLSDLAGLTWRNVDLKDGTITLETGKTGRKMVIPIAVPLRKELLSLPSADHPDAPLFPILSAKRQGTLSNAFNAILARAGLVEKKPHRKLGTGRDARRETSGLCFHCLRHTATSMLKSAGVSNAVAMEVIGHDTEAVSRSYTHMDTATLRKAIDTLPDITHMNEEVAL